jgi:hypothetical protein
VTAGPPIPPLGSFAGQPALRDPSQLEAGQGRWAAGPYGGPRPVPGSGWLPGSGLEDTSVPRSASSVPGCHKDLATGLGAHL